MSVRKSPSFAKFCQSNPQSPQGIIPFSSIEGRMSAARAKDGRLDLLPSLPLAGLLTGMKRWERRQDCRFSIDAGRLEQIENLKGGKIPLLATILQKKKALVINFENLSKNYIVEIKTVKSAYTDLKIKIAKYRALSRCTRKRMG